MRANISWSRLGRRQRRHRRITNHDLSESSSGDLRDSGDRRAKLAWKTTSSGLMSGSAASIELIVNACSIQQGRSALMRDDRATIRIDAATRPAEAVFCLPLSREFERV